MKEKSFTDIIKEVTNTGEKQNQELKEIKVTEDMFLKETDNIELMKRLNNFRKDINKNIQNYLKSDPN